jgi:hypothetical protein
MNRPLTNEELATMAVPVVTAMTRRDKLLRLATLVRAEKAQFFRMMHGLEYMTKSELRRIEVRDTIFERAAADPVFKDAGLKPDRLDEAVRFFELSREDLHSLACDCCGQLSNATVAKILETLSHPTARY